MAWEFVGVFCTCFLCIFDSKGRITNHFSTLIKINRAFFIGFFQSFALLPGISRSGATISGGMLSGLSRFDAGKFAFLMAIPVTIGPALLKIKDDSYLLSQYPYEMFSAFLSSFLFGLLALKLLTIFLKRGTLIPFIVYRTILVIFLIIFTSTR
ncbi:MAG: hypothetical protein EBV07_00605 [Proteobacteria bacterium]|nr:hypothetical protein [Pseudomonadota bacterium]